MTTYSLIGDAMLLIAGNKDILILLGAFGMGLSIVLSVINVWMHVRNYIRGR